MIKEEITPDELWEKTKVVTLSAAKQHIPRKKGRRSDWITEETLKLIEKRRSMKEGGASVASLEYRNARKEIQRACRRDKKQHLLQKCTSIEAHSKLGNSKDMYGEIRSLTRKFKPSLNVIKDKEGNTLTESPDILGRWKEYCSELYEDEEEEEEVEETETDDTPRRRRSSSYSNA